MNNLYRVVIFVTFVHIIPGFPHHSKRNFDPNQLMQQYMKLRTNQGAFGSFHPIDVKETVNEYFNNKEQTPNSAGNLEKQNIQMTSGFDPNGQSMFGGSQSPIWRFSSVYNPNKNLHKYISETFATGKLGPKDHNSNHGTLGSKTGEKQTDDKWGFDADKLNNNLMTLIHSNNFKPGMASGISYESTIGDQLKGTSIFQGYNSVKTDFDPDILNSQLIKDIGYDPNAVNSNSMKQFEPTIVKQMNQSIYNVPPSLPHGEYYIGNGNTASSIGNNASEPTVGTPTNDTNNVNVSQSAGSETTDIDYNALQSVLKNSTMLQSNGGQYETEIAIHPVSSGDHSNTNTTSGIVSNGNTNGYLAALPNPPSPSINGSVLQTSNSLLSGSTLTGNTNGYHAVSHNQFVQASLKPQSGITNNNAQAQSSHALMSPSSLIGNIQGYNLGLPDIDIQGTNNLAPGTTLTGNSNGYHIVPQYAIDKNQSANGTPLSLQLGTLNSQVSASNSLISGSTLMGNLNGYHAVIDNQKGNSGHENTNANNLHQTFGQGLGLGTQSAQSNSPQVGQMGASSTAVQATGIGSLGVVNTNNTSVGYVQSGNQIGAYNTGYLQASGIGTLGTGAQTHLQFGGTQTNMVSPAGINSQTRQGSSGENQPGADIPTSGIENIEGSAITRSGSNVMNLASHTIDSADVSNTDEIKGYRQGNFFREGHAQSSEVDGIANPSGIESLGDTRFPQSEIQTVVKNGQDVNTPQIDIVKGGISAIFGGRFGNVHVSSSRPKSTSSKLVSGATDFDGTGNRGKVEYN